MKRYSRDPNTPPEVVEFFSRLFRGEHHIPSAIKNEVPGSSLKNGCYAVTCFVGQMGMSTFDDDRLTRLVLLAHELCFRAVVAPSAPRYLKIFITKRDSDATEFTRRHPTIEQAVESFKPRCGLTKCPGDGPDWPPCKLAKGHDGDCD